MTALMNIMNTTTTARMTMMMMMMMVKRRCLSSSTTSHATSMFSGLRQWAHKTLTWTPKLPTVPERSQLRNETTTCHHGISIQDNLSWMHNPDDADVTLYLDEESSYADSVMKGSRHVIKRLRHELDSFSPMEDISVPEIIDGYAYFTQIHQQYGRMAVYIRQRVNDDGSTTTSDVPVEMVLNLNILSKGHPSFSLGILKLSPSSKLVAFTADVTGIEHFHGAIMRLPPKGSVVGTQPHLLDHISRAFNLEWASDEILFYTVPDSLHRPYRLYRHRLGDPESKDVLIFEETDPRFFLDVSRTKDKRFITINCNSKTSSEVHILDRASPCDSPRLIHPREPGLEYYVEHCDDKLVMVTNADGAYNYKVVCVAVATPGRKYWCDFVPHRPDTKVEDIDIFKNHCALYEKKGGTSQVTIVNLPKECTPLNDSVSASNSWIVPLPENIYMLKPGSNQTFDANSLRLSTSSPLSPESVFDIDLSQRVVTRRRRMPVGGPDDFNVDDYNCVREHAVSNDGAEIPITILSAKDHPMNGSLPLLLHVYGAYGHCVEPEFRPDLMVLLRRGWAVALCHVRGGGELGHTWHNEGKLHRKCNGIIDLVACAKHLHSSGLSSPALTAARGASAGGLLVGALLNSHPDLISAAILRVPFLDPLTAMLDSSLPLTVHEYDEWGNPETDPTTFKNMLAYSPYHNLKSISYPSLLVTTAINDDRVQFWQPAKYVARLRQIHAAANKNNVSTNVGSNLMLLKTHWEGGHFSTSDSDGTGCCKAFEIAFLEKALGINNLE